MAVNGQSFVPGSSLTLTLSVEAPGSQAPGDLYLAALTPSRSLVFLGPGLRPSASPVPFDARRALASGNASLGSIPLSSAVPAGPYRLFAVAVRPGTSPFEPINHLSNLASAELTFGATLSRESARRLADQAVDSPSLILRTVNNNTRALLRTLAAFRAGPGRSQAAPCPAYRILERNVTPDRQGVTSLVRVDYGSGCRDDDDGQFRRGSYLAFFDIARFDSRTFKPLVGTAILCFNFVVDLQTEMPIPCFNEGFTEFFEGNSSIIGRVTNTFEPDEEEVDGFTTEISPEETLTLLYNLTTTYDRVDEFQYVNGLVFLQSSVDGARATLFEDTAFDQLTEVDAFTCDDPIGGQITIGDQSDFAVFRFDYPDPGCGFAFFSLNGEPEVLIRLDEEPSSLRSALRAQKHSVRLSPTKSPRAKAARRPRR